MRRFISDLFLRGVMIKFLHGVRRLRFLRCRRKFNRYRIETTIEKLHMKFIENAEKRLGAAGGTSFAVAVAFLVKAIGALYKIPLYNLLGDYATGLYGMIFPLFAFLLCLSGSGVPVAVTRMISGGYDPEKVLKKTMAIFFSAGIVLSVLLFVFSRFIADLQGDSNAAKLYMAIAPSVFFVGVIAVFRGYFQGLSDMRPTAFSQLIEQLIRAVIGLIAAYLLPVSQKDKAFFAVLAITFSELCAALYFFILYYKKSKKTLPSPGVKTAVEAGAKTMPTVGSIMSIAVPLTLNSLLIPLSALAEGFIAVRALRSLFGDNGTALYGLYAGATETIISLPAAVLHPLASGFLPKMNDKKVAARAMLFTVIGGVSAGFIVFVFPQIIVKILFSGVSNKGVLIELLRLSSVTVALLPILQTMSLILVAKGGQKRALFNNILGAIVKIAVCAVLVYRAGINVFALAISDIACYFVALTLDLIYIITENKRSDAIEGRSDTNDNVSGTGYKKGRLVAESVQSDKTGG